MTKQRKTFAIALTSILAACANPPASITPPPLAGTAWQLHAIQSMNDSQGKTRIADPMRFIIRFDTPNRVSLRLDCNRASGTFTAKPVANGSC